MSAAPAVAAYTLSALRDCVTGLLLDLAFCVMPETYDCAACDNTMCARCCEQDAARERLEKAAAMASKAATEDEVRAAVMHALGEVNGGTE